MNSFSPWLAGMIAVNVGLFTSDISFSLHLAAGGFTFILGGIYIELINQRNQS